MDFFEQVFGSYNESKFEILIFNEILGRMDISGWWVYFSAWFFIFGYSRALPIKRWERIFEFLLLKKVTTKIRLAYILPVIFGERAREFSYFASLCAFRSMDWVSRGFDSVYEFIFNFQDNGHAVTWKLAIFLPTLKLLFGPQHSQAELFIGSEQHQRGEGAKRPTHAGFQIMGRNNVGNFR